jgi:hypothetical protein
MVCPRWEYVCVLYADTLAGDFLGGQMMKNKEGYPDPTAGRAIRNADQQPEQVQWYFRTVRELANLVDLEVEKLPKIRDKKTGRLWP